MPADDRQPSNLAQNGPALHIDPEARRAFYGDTLLNIGAGRRFDILQECHRQLTKIVPHINLERLVKPERRFEKWMTKVSSASPELREEIRRIKKAFELADCPYEIVSVRTHGYLLQRRR